MDIHVGNREGMVYMYIVVLSKWHRFDAFEALQPSNSSGCYGTVLQSTGIHVHNVSNPSRLFIVASIHIVKLLRQRKSSTH